ncbi:hypothetical protein L211DRAFT_842692 [Terfezia boudieri ATCC MYA-4762]|uniref:Uncharacterized protein n=1 Tax=Terfezia boudieri ATCC MYA-4762 TaxID=1051890 RepID=A0A3N4LFI7_9PEZI|nr:hypothetical protein L211DRAFT_842692 [Terfezia boudieri ATCC MYA-4762]
MSSAQQPTSTAGNNAAAAEAKTEQKKTNQGFSLEEDDEFEDFPVEGEFLLFGVGGVAGGWGGLVDLWVDGEGRKRVRRE